VMGGSTAGCPALPGVDLCGVGAECEHAPMLKITPSRSAGVGNRPGRSALSRNPRSFVASTDVDLTTIGCQDAAKLAEGCRATLGTTVAPKR
jgi:hypothetical protein